MDNICGIVLKVSYPSMGDTSNIEILGKTMLEWVCIALGSNYSDSVAYSDSVPLPQLVRPYVNRESDYTVVLYSDTPLITPKTVSNAVAVLKQRDLNVLKMTRGYVFKTKFLLAIDKIYSENPFYFDEEDFMTAFDFKQVALVSDALKNRIITYHMNQGVQFDDPASTFVGCEVIIARGVRIGPGNIIKGKTIIKEHSSIGSRNTIDGSVIDSGAWIESSYVLSSFVGKHTRVGPNAYIRPGTVVGADCRVGDFVELKNSTIGDRTKIAHLTYVGDATVGKDCNLGCGVVIANYDGKAKHKTVIGDGAFIGSNSNLIAPLKVGDGAFIAAGSTITDEVPNKALAIARERQVIKPNWIK
ncbi:MAG: hypothetical protein J1F36_00700 [Clostridiales bacterium]|nr:hypothetical protein [Clostridiales bacterium]